MIHYALRCAAGHGFDGWFKNSRSFEGQAEAGLIACPECADTSVTRALMAPSVHTRQAPAPLPGAAPVPAASHAMLPDQASAVLQRLRTEVETHCEYVGPGFAEEARQIAAGVAPARPIYGEATADEEAALNEDGIAYARIPWVPRAQ